MWWRRRRNAATPTAAPRHRDHDRPCSAEVVISQTYNNQFPVSAGLALVRGADGTTPWSASMPVSGSNYIQWWCHSTTGNTFDPGTWRIIGGGVVCNDSGCIPGTSAVNGWTPEQSRCDSAGTTSITARLGPNRLLEMRCFGT
jgi:hypothetical protein